jgi:Ca-activated chloride channel homolog
MLLKIKFFNFIGFFSLIFFSCSGGNNKTISSNQYENFPSYSIKADREFNPTEKKRISSFPLESTSYSYSNLKDAVDNSSYPSFMYTEELLNSFSYNYPKIKNESSLGIYLESATSPWDAKKKLVHIGVYGGREAEENKKENLPKNLIIAFDTSGSMSIGNSMELAKNSLHKFINGLNEIDSVGIIEYTDDAKIFLPPTNLKAKTKILNSIFQLRPTGGTNAWPGILLAYKLAKQMKTANHTTKILVISDGDFGGVNNEEFLSLVDNENRNGITISILGFGLNKSKNNLMELLASSKKGDSSYIDSLEEANKYLSLQTWATWKSIAKDINVEVTFNSDQVESFRLLGFEKYSLSKSKKIYDAGSGFSYTALYEITTTPSLQQNSDLIKIRLNYKTNKNKMEEVTETLKYNSISAWEASELFRFSAGIAGLGMLLNNSIYKGNVDYNMIIHLMQGSILYDPEGNRAELFDIVNRLKNL